MRWIPLSGFSTVGHQKGFDDRREMLLFEISKIAKKNKPKVIFLKNIKNLKSHDKGNIFKIISSSLDSLNHAINTAVLNAITHVNIPQSRENFYHSIL